MNANQDCASSTIDVTAEMLRAHAAEIAKLQKEIAMLKTADALVAHVINGTMQSAYMGLTEDRILDLWKRQPIKDRCAVNFARLIEKEHGIR